jgi:hypothetical protein
MRVPEDWPRGRGLTRLSLLPAGAWLIRLSTVLALSAAPDRQAPAESAQTSAVLANDALRLAFEVRPDGIEWISLRDVAAAREMLAGGEPFWRLVVEDSEGKKQTLDNRSGWKHVSIVTKPARDSGVSTQHSALTLAWRGATVRSANFSLALEVRCEISLQGPRSTWNLSVENASSYSLRTVTFPSVVTRPLGDDSSDDEVVWPRGPGERHVDPFTKPVSYGSDYPTGWGSCQFMAHYDRAGGVYVATHDPVASTKYIEAGTRANGKQWMMEFRWPAENATIPSNDFDMPGPAVVEVFRGDWFDAALIYRQWARRNARWWPSDESRSDTPRWMHDVAIWAMTGGTTQSVVGPVRDFAAYMGVPTALHWYNWHRIPFDTDYPHYFPAKPGFPDGVKELRAAGVRVMPYINGRLWDTGLEDFEKMARPFATKDERGNPYIEEYGSKRKLAPMCPATKLWQDKVNGIVLRLVGEGQVGGLSDGVGPVGPVGPVGVDGVYIDQVAAAKPCLCFDRSHGHPLAGGHWWMTLGYWPMLERLRTDMKTQHPDAMITTECNGEAYVRFFDGYLTWHWQYDGQVPVWPAIYGGRVQMFGRAYRGGPTRDLALRMKAAQSLVYGEQIGWLGPEVIREKDNGPFIRRMARLRYALRDYLADGEMARPPRLIGDIPNVTADWQWHGVWPVTDRAVQAGAWRARDGRLALIFVNVTTGTLSFDLDFNGKDYGVTGNKLRLTPRTETGLGETVIVPSTFRRPIHLEPLEDLAFELTRAE